MCLIRSQAKKEKVPVEQSDILQTVNLNKAISCIVPSRDQVTLCNTLLHDQSIRLFLSGVQLMHCQDTLRLSVLEAIGVNSMAVIPLVGCPLILIPPQHPRLLDSKYHTPE